MISSTIELDVRFSETDAMGIVYHANKWMFRDTTEIIPVIIDISYFQYSAHTLSCCVYTKIKYLTDNVLCRL